MSETFNELAAQAFIALQNHEPSKNCFPQDFADLDKKMMTAWDSLTKAEKKDQREILALILEQKSKLLNRNHALLSCERITQQQAPDLFGDLLKNNPLVVQAKEKKAKVTSFVLKKGADRRVSSVLVGHDNGDVQEVEVLRVQPS